MSPSSSEEGVLQKEIAEFVKSKHGNPNLTKSGFIYVKHKENADGSIRWKCERARYFKCGGWAKTFDDQICALSTMEKHNHEPEDIFREKIRVSDRKRAVKSHKVDNTVVAQFSSPVSDARSTNISTTNTISIMQNAADFDFFEDRYPKRTRKPINKPEIMDDLEDEVLFQKQKLMSHCVYDIQEIVSSEEFKDDSVLKLSDAKGFNAEHIKEFGLSTPILFTMPPEELGMIVPEAETFTVFDVLELAGKERKIEVVEVNEQKGRTMKLADFVKYYTCPPEFRTELLNVLSLEFSLTNLAKMVKAPAFVSEIDWIDNVWPKELFDRQLAHMKTNHYSDFSTYPKVQRYCLMSVANCFTDFHIDFGGTSVWYHVLKGRKIFWLIEPTEENLLLYEEWIMGGNNSESFFGRIVNKCNRVELVPGMTFIIPSGWIHCVFTPEDSLVFGGNFLHSYAIPMQVRVVRSEDRIRVGTKYRFPHFKQMIWYVIENVVRKATGRIYLRPIKPKAYLADLHHYQVQVTVPDEADEAELTDDQEPCCSSAVETGCKKSGLVKETFLSGMGMEDSESDNDEHHSDSEEKLNDPNICYDDMPNGADNCYMLVPTQFKYSAKNNEKFMPVDCYDEEYLSTIPSVEVNGYFSLLEYAKKLIKTKRPEVGEGITRPKHLLQEFEYLLFHISKAGQFDVAKDFDLKGNSCELAYREQSRELVVSLRVFESVTANFKEPSKKRKVKRKLATPKTEETKKGVKAGKNPKRASCPMPILVDGLPHPLQSSEPSAPNPYGFNPLETIVALGQKPLPSAYRQSTNMAQLPPNQRFKLKKKVSSTEEENGSKDDKTGTMDSNSLLTPQRGTLKSPSSDIKQPSKFSVHSFSAHSEDPSLAYKSPLQRLQEEKQRKLQQQSQQPQLIKRVYSEQDRGGGYGEQGKGGSYNEHGRGGGYDKQFKGDEQGRGGSYGDHGRGGGYGEQFKGGEQGRGGSYGDHGRGGGYGEQFKGGEQGRSSSYGEHGRGGGYGEQFKGGEQGRGSSYGEHGRGGGYGDQGRSSGYGERNRGGHGGYRERNMGGRGSYGNRRWGGEDRRNGINDRGGRNDRFEGRYSNNNSNHYGKNEYNNGGRGGDRWNNRGGYNRGRNDRGGGYGNKHQYQSQPYPPQHQPPAYPSFPTQTLPMSLPPPEVASKWGLPPIPDHLRHLPVPHPMLFQGGMPPVGYNMSAGYGVPQPESQPSNFQFSDAMRPPPPPTSASVSNNSAVDSADNTTLKKPWNAARISDERSAHLPVDKSALPLSSIQIPAVSASDVAPAQAEYSYGGQYQNSSNKGDSSPQAVAMDGFEGIDEIGRLTKMMGNEDNEDVDMRDPKFFVHSTPNNGFSSSVANGGNGAAQNDAQSLGDLSTDIDEIFRLSQMYEQ